MKPGSTASITDAPPPALADGPGLPRRSCRPPARRRGRPRGESTSPARRAAIARVTTSSTGPTFSTRTPASSSASGSSASSCEASSAAGMKWPARSRDPLAEVVRGHHQLHERRSRARGADRVAVGAAQRRAGDDQCRRRPRRAPRPTSRSHGHRSSSSSGTPARIFSTFAAGCRSSASMNAMPGNRATSRSASASPTTDLPRPLGPITTRRGGAATAVMRCRLADARRRAAASDRRSRTRDGLSRNSAQR